MLVAYQKNYQKIVMGLLSFESDLQDYDRLKEEVTWGQQPGYQIYLWKKQSLDQFIAVMIVQTGLDYVLLRRISFSPSERSGREMYRFISAVAEKFPNKRMMGTLKTQSLVTNWQRDLHYQAEQRERKAKHGLS